MNPVDFLSPDRYSRQTRVPGIGRAGQERLLNSRVTLAGCGALGTVLANTLVRAGVGFVRVIDRDFIEPSNLQRQVLFDEADVRDNLPKAEAAARKLRAINSGVTIEPVVADVDRTNVEELCRDADVILDGADNLELRYLLNDVAVKLGKPWVHGGAVGTYGQTMTIIPGQTPCFRCVFEASPDPGDIGTCETAGVLGPAVSVIASIQAAEAIKLLVGKTDAVSKELFTIDLWENSSRRVKIGPLLGKVDCPCCQRRQFQWLEGEFGQQTTSLCGRNAVQVSHRSAAKLDFAGLAKQLSESDLGVAKMSHNRFLMKFDVESYQFTVFPDGRAIIKGTDDVDKARVLYAKYIGY